MSIHLSSPSQNFPSHHSTSFPSSSPSSPSLFDSLSIPVASHPRQRSKSDWTLSLGAGSNHRTSSSPSFPSSPSLPSPAHSSDHSPIKRRKRHVSAHPALPSISSVSVSTSSQASSISFPSQALPPASLQQHQFSQSLRKSLSVGGESSLGSGEGLNERWDRHIENGKKARLTEVRHECQREEDTRNSVDSVWDGRGRTFELVVGKDGLPAKLDKGALRMSDAANEGGRTKNFGQESWEFQVAAALLNGGVSPPSSPVRPPRNPSSHSSPSSRTVNQKLLSPAARRSRNISPPFDDRSHWNKENFSTDLVRQSKSSSNLRISPLPLEPKRPLPPPPSCPLSFVSHHSTTSSVSSLNIFHDASDTPSHSPASFLHPSPILVSPPSPSHHARPRTFSYKPSNRASLTFSPSKSHFFSTSPSLERYEVIDLYALTHMGGKVEDVPTSEEGSNASFVVELPVPLVPSSKHRRTLSLATSQGVTIEEDGRGVIGREGAEKGKWCYFIGLFCAVFGWIGSILGLLGRRKNDRGNKKGDRGIGYTKEKSDDAQSSAQLADRSQRWSDRPSFAKLALPAPTKRSKHSGISRPAMSWLE